MLLKVFLERNIILFAFINKYFRDPAGIYNNV